MSLQLSERPVGRAVRDVFAPAIDEGAMKSLRFLVGLEGRQHVANIIMAREQIMPGDWRWHISASGEDDVLSWSVMVEIAHKLRPGVVFVIGVPPRSWWLNIQSNTLHMWEMKDDNLAGQWRFERQGHTPS